MGKKEKQEEIKSSKGDLLKKARKSKGLSLEMVHEATNIPMDVLKGIEEGYQVRTISSFYYKGFLKLYANYLDVDVKDVLEDHQKEQLPKYVKRDVEEFDFKEWFSKLLTRKQKQQLVIAIGGVLALVLFFKFISFFTHKPSSDMGKASVKKEVQSKKVSKEKKKARKGEKKILKKEKKSVKPVKIVSKKEPVKSAQEKTSKVVEKKINSVNVVKTATVSSMPARSVRKDVTLTVRAKKSCWLRVKSDGVIVFQSTLRLGAVETWMANEKIEISGRNINQLEFELNGKMIGTLGRKDRGAKGLIITKDGLTVTNKR